MCGVLAADPIMGWRLVVLLGSPEKAEVMEFKLFIGNLSRLTTQEDLFNLFAGAGDVLQVNLITDKISGISKGFAFILMSAQSEADKAVSMFNSYPLDEHYLKVSLAKPRERRGFGNGY